MVPQTKEQAEQFHDPESCWTMPFFVFALICDSDGEIRPSAALRFQTILSDHPRVTSRLFRQMLDFCRDHYRRMWRDYAGSKLPVTPDRFLGLMQILKKEIAPADFADLGRDLAWLAKKLYRASFALIPRRIQKEAYANLMLILRGGRLPPHTVRQKEVRLEGGPGRGTKAESRGRASNTTAPAFAPLPQESQIPPETILPDQPASTPISPSAHEPDSPELKRVSVPRMPRQDAAWVKGALKLVCVKVTCEARSVKTFSFAHSQSAWFCYQPGQFLTIEPVIDGKTVARSYTISSTPTRPGLLEITVKRVPGGLVSNWLHDNLRVGSAVMARGPFGKFTCLNFQREKYLFLSGGSGITPLMSMLRYLHDLAAPADVVFFHSASTQDDIVFRKELSLYGERNPNLRIHVSLTGEAGESAWDGLRGRLDNGMLHQIAPDFMERTILACGPVGFMDKAKQLLAGNGFPFETQFDEESFVPKPPRKVEGQKDAGTERRSKVIFVKSGKTLEISTEETILEAAEKCRLDIPSSCRQGRCGTCRATKLSGDILMPGQEALSPDEIAQGEILTCVGQPNSSIVEVEL